MRRSVSCFALWTLPETYCGSGSGKKKLLKLKTGSPIGKAYGLDEKHRLIENAKQARSPHIYPALMLALNAGACAMRK